MDSLAVIETKLDALLDLKRWIQSLQEQVHKHETSMCSPSKRALLYDAGARVTCPSQPISYS